MGNNPPLRKGMWVLVSDAQKVGITTSILDKGHQVPGAEVHLVGEDGHTFAILPYVPVNELQQASWEDIPTCRRPTMAVAARFGYTIGRGHGTART